MSKDQLLPESIKEVLTEESVQSIEEAIKDKLTLSVEAALASQDELYSEKLQELMQAIDKDHSSKLKRIVEAVDRNNAEKLVIRLLVSMKVRLVVVLKSLRPH